MTIKLPDGWGPATILVVLYAAFAAVGGVVELWQGDMNYTEFVDSMKYAAGATGLLAIGRGFAYGGQGTGFGTGSSRTRRPTGGFPTSRTRSNRGVNNSPCPDLALVAIAVAFWVFVLFGANLL